MERDYDLDAAIRKVPDFPKAGILFYDITSILMNPEAFAHCIARMESRYSGAHLDGIAAVESRGFLFAAPFAYRLGLPILLVRKAGKLPGETVSKTYELEYGSDTIEMHRADLESGKRILIVDDLIATGGTVRAAADLITEAGSEVHEVFSVIGLPFLGYEERLAPVGVHTLITYEGE
ncbi:MAG: adenine phosphoribosyltransferase [Spirochaetota bacterium]